MERYWYRKAYDLKLQMQMNPFIETKPTKPPIEATTPEGLAELSRLGVTVKQR